MVAQEFVRSGLVHHTVKTTKNRTTYCINLPTLKQLEVKRWSRQRPADEKRVEEIRKFLEQSDDISGVLSLAWHPTEGLVIYDGQHRWNALLKLSTFNSKILVEILWDATPLELEMSFLAINRCVAVPELYTDTTIAESSIRTEITDFVASLCNTHKEFLSTTDKPNRPNFNRDRLTTELFEIWRDDFHKEVPFTKIAKGLLALNDEYDMNPITVPHHSIKKFPRIAEKCKKHSFWLFAQNGHINVQDLREVLNKLE